jgi:hypothetical protein
MIDVVIAPVGPREGDTVKPSEYLQSLWPARYRDSLRGRVRFIHNYGQETVQDVEVRWNGAAEYTWYRAYEVEVIDE